MWMRGSYNDGSEFSTIQDSFGPGRKLRPLMPRPTAAACSFYGHDQLLTLNHHFAMVEQSKREVMGGGGQQVVVSARWNPTPEQVQTLEELYRQGTRTPSADEIQQITVQLRRYGKIEGKNVFYWFQNHKARERQKRRRQTESSSDELKRDSSTGVNKRGYEVEQSKNWVSSTSCRTIAEKTSVVSAEAESKSGWLQLDDADSESQHLLVGKNSTWQQTMHLSSSPITSASDIVTTVRTTPDNNNNDNTNPAVHVPRHHFVVDKAEYAQTLQLFPVQSNEEEEKGDDEEDKSSNYQFFEFLPLKN